MMKTEIHIKKFNLFIILIFLSISLFSSIFFIFNIRELLIQLVENFFNRTLNHFYWHKRIIYVVLTLFSFFTMLSVYLLIENLSVFKQLNNSKKNILYFVLIILFSSILLILPDVYEGHDLTFHLMRIEGISNELKNHVFPVRIQSIWLDGYGYPVSIYYGDILLYIPALLHLLGISLISSYKLFVFMINIATVFVAYYSFKNIFLKQKIALLLTLIYSTAPYRFIDIFVRCAVGEYSAFVFFPVITLSIYLLYTDELNIQKQIKACFLLTIGMSGLILTHILSTEIVIIILFIVCLINYKKTFTKPVILTIVSAIIITLFLCAGFVIPFLDYYFNVPVQINNVTHNKIQKSGMYLIQLFLFFQNPYGLNSTVLKERMLLSPGLPIITGIIISLFYYIKIKRDKELLFLILITFLSIFLSSNIFPWDFISNYKIGNLFTKIQFPWRWLGIVMILSVVLIGRILLITDNKDFKSNKYSKLFNKFFVILQIFVFIQSFSFCLQYSIGYSNYEIQNYKEVGSDKVGGAEYIRIGTDYKERSTNINAINVELSNIIRKDKYFKLHIYAKENGYIELPIYNYKGYEAVDIDGQKLEITDGINNVIKIIIPKGFDSDIVVKFVEPIIWRISEIVSFVTILFILIFYYNYKRRMNI